MTYRIVNTKSGNVVAEVNASSDTSALDTWAQSMGFPGYAAMDPFNTDTFKAEPDAPPADVPPSKPSLWMPWDAVKRAGGEA